MGDTGVRVCRRVELGGERWTGRARQMRVPVCGFCSILSFFMIFFYWVMIPGLEADTMDDELDKISPAPRFEGWKGF